MFIILLITFGVSRSQMSPRDLARDFLVDLVMKDSSQFFGIVLQKPAPDRILFQTRYGRLEIPLQDISYAIDYRFNYVLHDNLLEDASKNAIDVQKNNVLNFTGQQKAEFISLVHTDTHDDF
ncbi:MAG TPA: hypothetical protein VET48_14615, partial [Steroidobacteraceae bacterium]|nr:hypothetical protein [Steroidobacteraceae bacterium]